MSKHGEGEKSQAYTARETLMLEEFKKFAMRGNVADLAVGVIIGAAFGAIVSSMVGDLIMPIIGAVTGGLDFSNYYLPLSSAVKTGQPLADAKKAGAVLAYGNFITAALNFLIIAFVLFIVIQGMNRLKKKEDEQPAVPPAPTTTEKLLSEIRDLLKTQSATGRRPS
jgi:large conductance mechanosensitive channel protein